MELLQICHSISISAVGWVKLSQFTGGGRPVGLKWFGQPHEIRLVIITIKIDRTWVIINFILSYTYIVLSYTYVAYNLDPYV